MAVLVTCHKLVERDAKNVDILWKAASIVLLVLAIFCSLGISLSFQRIVGAFEERCVLFAELEFEPIPTLSETSSSFAIVPTRNSKKFVNLSHIFNESYANFLGGDELPIDQVEFMMQNQISLNSSWRKSCDFSIYIPICQSSFGIIMAVMFAICGKGGKSDQNSFLPQPWRIVSPALVFFLVMTLLSLINLVIVQNGMDSFCKSFEQQLPDVGCDVAMNRFMLVPYDSMNVSPGVLYKVLTPFNYGTFVLWLLSVLVLLARIIFVIDFQLVRVTIKTFEYETESLSGIESKSRQNFDTEDEFDPNGKSSDKSCITTTRC